MSALTAEVLRQLLTYDPASGCFTWIASGKQVGRSSKRGRRLIRVAGNVYLESRIAWLYMTGAWPVFEIDHKDLNTLNNRWANLREATKSQNNANRPLSVANNSGVKGVSMCRQTGKWRATIKKDGKQVHLGRFESKTLAAAAYASKAKEMFGEFARVA